MNKFTLVILGIIIIIGAFLIIRNFRKNKKEEGYSDLLIVTGGGLITTSFGTAWDKVLPTIALFKSSSNISDMIAIIDKSTGSNYIQLGIGIVLLIAGITLKIYVKNKLFILNINGYEDKRIESHSEDLKLSTFEFKEREIDFIRIFKSGVNENTVAHIKEEISNKVTAFKNESKEFKRAYTGIAPTPFIMYAGTFLKKDKIDEYLEYDKIKTHRYYKLTNAKREKYPLLKLNTNIENLNTQATDIVLAVSITSDIVDAQMSQFNGMDIVKLSVDNTSDNNIRYKEQLNAYVQMIYNTIDEVGRIVPNLKRIHLLYSGQSCLSLELGKIIDDRRMAQVICYQYKRETEPMYPWGIVINGDNKGKLIECTN